MYGLQGGGGVGVGDSSPFGTQFGWYAKLIVDKWAAPGAPANCAMSRRWRR